MLSKNICEKKFESKKIFFPKDFCFKKLKFLVQTIFWFKEKFGYKNFLVGTNLSSKKFLGPKIWVQEKFGVQKNLNLKNILSQKFLVPPPIPTA